MSNRTWFTYVVALSVTAAAAVLRLALSPLLGDDLPYLTFFAAVIIAAWYGGLRPGLLATLASGATASYLFLAPVLQTRGPRWGDAIGLLLFGAIGWLMSDLSSRLQGAKNECLVETERLRTTLRSIGDGVIVTDAHGRVTSLNSVAERLTGWTTADAVGRDLPQVFRIVNEETREDVENPALQALRQGTVVSLSNHTVLVSKQGDERPIDDCASPIRIGGDRIDGSILVFRDVSERRRADDALRRSEQELTDFFNNASVALHWVGPDGVILRANQAELDLLGYDADEYVGRHIADFHEDRGVIGDILTRLTSGEVLRDYPSRLRCRDGSLKDVLISSSVRRDQGRFLHTRCFTVDVTDRKRADAQRALLAAIVDSSGDVIISKTLEGQILSWNTGAMTMLGYSPEEIVGRSVTVIIPESRHAEERHILDLVGRGERVESFETVRVARDGRHIDVSLTVSPIRDETGTIVGASSIARDIGRRKDLERSLQQADRRKDEFLAVLAHELRNPLAPIRNSVSTLQLLSPDDALLRRTTEIIERQTGNMTRLLDDLLDVSRITSSRLDLRKETVTIQSVLNLAFETSRPLIDVSRQTLSISVPSEPITTDVDTMRLAQVFSNLLNNASKFSSKGGEIRVSARRDDSDVVVTVADDGIGIERAALPTIFDMFSQASHALDRAQGGLGIGLSLVRGLVQLHGGHVTAHSDGAGRGSVFEVRLPTAVPRHVVPTATPCAGGSSASLRVLIADDNQDGADSLSLMLQGFGHEVRTVYDGQAAVQEVTAFRPDVALLDLGMPGMSGFETARRIRATAGGDVITLIAVTGWGQERDRQRTAAAGFDAHIVKPVDPAAIQAMLGGPRAG
jgi:PAS domain S-box-containing protein